MTLAQIDYLGWIEHKNYEDPEYLTLTGSATIAKFKSDLKNVSVLIDYGMFQGGRDDDFANSSVDQKALQTDCMVLTHAHLDHAWRVPLLVKNGYKKPIYMTSITAQKIYVMLEDYIKIMTEEREIAVAKFQKIKNQASGFLYAIEAEKKLKKNGLSREQKEEIKWNLIKFFGEQYNLSEIIQEALAFQDEYQIYSSQDIQKRYNEIPEILYDMWDLADTMKYIKVLDYGQSIDLNNLYYVDEFSEESLKKMMKRVYTGSNESLYIDSTVFSQYMWAINQRIETTKLAEIENTKIKAKNNLYESNAEELELIVKFLQQYPEIDNPTSKETKTHQEYLSILKTADIELKDLVNITKIKLQYDEYKKMLDIVSHCSQEESPELYNEYSKKLELDWIENEEDLENFLKSYQQDVYDVKYSSDLLEKLKDLFTMKVLTGNEKNKNHMKSLQLQLLDAWHIEWSAQALITVVSEKVNKTLDTGNKTPSPLDIFAKKAIEHKNFLFTWDLWRRKDPNISGTWETSPYKLDFLQIETTYAGRNHPDRMQEEREFINTIEEAKWKVIIPAFSMQRTQELAILLLETMQDHLPDLEKLEEYKKNLAVLEEQLKGIKDTESRTYQMYAQNIKGLKNEIHRLKTTSPVFWNINLNSPLGDKISNIYLQNLYSKYKLLDPDVQEKIFGRVVINNITNTEQLEELYTDKRKDRKEIVISASGMCTGWFIQKHLLKNLENPKSTILFTGYCPPNSPGGRIKQNLPVILSWESNVAIHPKCNIVDNKAFSWHLDHEEILMYIQDLKDQWKLARNATIALNHGWDKRELVKADLLEGMLKTKRNVDILMPNLWDSLKIAC